MARKVRWLSKSPFSPLMPPRAFTNAQKLDRSQKAAVAPLFMGRSKGLAKSVSANLREQLRTTLVVSAMKEALACRMRHGKLRPGTKKGCSGISSSEAMVTLPRPMMPGRWVARRPDMPALAARRAVMNCLRPQ